MVGTVVALMVLLADPAVVIDSHVTETWVKESGAVRIVNTVVYRLKKAEGAKELTTFRYHIDPLSNDIRILSVKRITRDGRKVKIPYTISQIPQPAGWILWGFKDLVLTVPAIDVGEALEIRYQKVGFQLAYLVDEADRFVPPMRGHFYDIVLFGNAKYPTGERRYILHLPASKRLNVRVYNGPVLSSIRYSRNETRYEWWKTDVEPVPKEKRHVYTMWDSATKVVMATVPDWRAKSRWFYHVNKNQFEPSPQIRAKVREILRGAKTRQEKMARLLYWVAEFVRYRGFSMGKGEGYTLHPGTMVFETRAGVCKDIASMLVTMLKAAGFEVYPAMTMASSPIAAEIAADQFNHSVVAVKNPDGTFTMLDPTWAPYSRYVWSHAEREQYYLVGTPEGEDIAMTPPDPASANSLKIAIATRLGRDGASSTMRLSGSGYKETSLRRLMASRPALERKGVFLQLLAPMGLGLKIRSFSMTGPFEFDGSNFQAFTKPFAITVKFERPGSLMRSKKAIAYRPAAFVPFLSGRLAEWRGLTARSRKTAVLLRSSQDIEITETFTVPARYRIEEIHDRAGGTLAWASVDATQKGRRVTVRVRIVMQRRYYTPEQYPDLRDAVKLYESLGSRWLVATAR